MIGSSEKHLSRIYDALKLRLRSQSLVHGDQTTVHVPKEKDREATDTSYMWGYRSGEDSDQPIVLLDYQPGRGQIHPQAFLGDYRGTVMSDGYSAWRALAGATHLGCMAHSRRRFHVLTELPQRAAAAGINDLLPLNFPKTTAT